MFLLLVMNEYNATKASKALSIYLSSKGLSFKVNLNEENNFGFIRKEMRAYVLNNTPTSNKSQSGIIPFRGSLRLGYRFGIWVQTR